MREGLSTETLKSIYGRVARRYDFQHSLLTADSDGRGRRILVEQTVHQDDRILDCGAGTGSTALLAAGRAGSGGRVTLFDLSEEMLAVARAKAEDAGVSDRLEFETGDMLHLPFPDDSFDVVLSTYSLCPVYNPSKGALEMYRVVRPGGLVGIAHSTEARNRLIRPIANAVENLAWRFRTLSIGCRAVEVLPALEQAGGRVVFSRAIGVPLWPFAVFVVQKPSSPSETSAVD